MTTTTELSVRPPGPAVVTAATTPARRSGWLAAHRSELEAAVTRYGAVLIRGLGVRDVTAAAEASRALTARLTTEREPFAHRTRYPPGLYSSAQWPPDQPMCMHHESSYPLEVPARLVFCCLTAPVRGGAVGLADAAAVLRDLPARLVERFDRHGWELRRAHGDIVGVPWPDTFGTHHRPAVERYLRANDIRWRWDGDGGLRTRRVRPAVVRHPRTGERLWFNQAAFLNEWTMDPAVREYLAHELGPDGLPFNTRCGDGTPLDQGTVGLINEVYDRHTVREPWQAGDVLVVDNIRMAHSREPYEGPREVVVAFGDPVRLP